MTIQKILNDISEDFFLSNAPADIEEMINNGVIDKEAVVSKWLGYPPATLQDIQAKEKQLGTTLPPSYKEFLLTSNGFRQVSVFLYNLFPIDKVDWTTNTEPQWWFDIIDQNDLEVSDEEYFVYGHNQRSELARDEYQKHSLKICDCRDGMCVFLNPIVKHGDEWEVLEYATWYPGTRRYRSFKEYLIETHEINLSLRSHEYLVRS